MELNLKKLITFTRVFVEMKKKFYMKALVTDTKLRRFFSNTQPHFQEYRKFIPEEFTAY